MCKSEWQDKERLSYFEKVFEILTAKTDAPSETSAIVSDNHGVSAACLDFGVKSGLLIKAGNTIVRKSNIYGYPQIALSVAT